MKTKKVLLVSCSLIIICMSVMIGTAYALFTGSASVNNHLKAGDLKVTMTRKSLEYTVLNEKGELEKETDGKTLDFADIKNNRQNVFGIDSESVRIVPGSYFEAEVEIANTGSTAFTYNVGIKQNTSEADENNDKALAEQLKVTVKVGEETKFEGKLSELIGNGKTVATGEIVKGGKAQSFTVCVEFVGDTANDSAQSGEVNFDLFVEATQATVKADAAE